jgi:DNA damage-inducible protein 1
VDSGAQSTIISARKAEECGLLKLMDKRFAGMAIGVG